MKVGGERTTEKERKKERCARCDESKKGVLLKNQETRLQKNNIIIHYHRSTCLSLSFREIEKNCRGERAHSSSFSLISSVGLRARPERDELPRLLRVPLDDGLPRRHVLAPELPAVAELADVGDPRGDARVGGDLLVDPGEERGVELRVLGEPKFESFF